MRPFKQFFHVSFVLFKLDLRSASSREDLISREEGQTLAKKLKVPFCETSSLALTGLKQCFEAAVGVALGTIIPYTG